MGIDMDNNVYVLQWYGPFLSKRDVLDWEEENIGPGKTYLYLFKGKKPHAKTSECIYCGQAFKQSAGKRLGNKKHHINEVANRKEDLTIWVAKFGNKKPQKYDVNLAEKVITSVFDQVIITDNQSMLNETNKLRPRDTAYIINEWYYRNGEPVLRYKRGSICSYLPDVLVCYPNDDNHESNIWGTKRLSFINSLK